MAAKSNTNKTIDKVFVGKEPIIAEIFSRNDSEFVRALNWYNYVHDISDGKPWLLQWMKMEKFDKSFIEAVRKTADWAIPTTICWVARMAMNGTKFSEANIDYVKGRINEIHAKYLRTKTEDTDETTTNVVSIQDRTKAKGDYILTLAEEEVVDGFMLGTGLSMYLFLQKHSCTAAAANTLRAHYIKSRDELFSGDPQVKEAYGKDLKKYQTFWQGVIDDIDRYIGLSLIHI